MPSVRTIVKSLLPKRARKLLGDRGDFCRSSYAQEGEDRILAEMFNLNFRSTPGSYVDVGAHHPEKYSNTFLFYTHGWSGINIDAMPGSMEIFKRDRSRDINLEVAIGDEEKVLMYYEFNEPALNGFSRETAQARDQYRSWKIIRERPISTVRLDKLLEQYLPAGRRIDFLSVDVEGLDLNVLKSNNWKKFRPAVVLVEDDEAGLGRPGGPTRIASLMQENGYVFGCKTVLTTFFLDQNELEATPMGSRLRQVGVST